MRALICAREYGSSEWPNTWTPSMWEDNAVQNLSRQTMTTTIWYCMNLYIYIYYMPCSQALVLAVPTAGINWQIGPCDRRNEWVGGTSALSNIKLMGRTIGASTALCMTAAKTLPSEFAFKLKFKFSNGTSSDSQQPCPLWIKALIKVQAKTRLAKPTSLIHMWQIISSAWGNKICKSAQGYNILMLQQLSRVWEQTCAVAHI